MEMVQKSKMTISGNVQADEPLIRVSCGVTVQSWKLYIYILLHNSILYIIITLGTLLNVCCCTCTTSPPLVYVLFCFYLLLPLSSFFFWLPDWSGQA